MLTSIALVVVALFVLVAIAVAVRAGDVGSRLYFITTGSDIGALNLAAADAVLKDDYKGPTVEQLNNANVTLAQLEKNTDDFVGRRFVQSIHVGRNSGVGARGENATLPTAGNQQYEDIFGPIRYVYGRIQLTGPTIAAMKKGRGSFLRALDSEMEGIVRDGTRDLCRQAWGTSDGKICGVNTINSGTLTPPGIRQDQLRHLDEDFLVDIGTTADPDSLAAGRSVTSVNYDTGSFVISGAAVNVTAGTHFVSRAGAGGTSSNTGNPGDGQFELTGLQTIVDDTAVLHTLDPASETKWKAGVFTNPAAAGTNRAISENIVTKALQKQSIKGGKMANLLVCGDGVHRAYTEVLSTMKRTTNTIELKGGYLGLEHGSVMQGIRKKGETHALAWDQDCPDNRMFGLDTEALRVMVLEDFDWIEGTNGVLIQVGDTDAFSGTMFSYREIACNRRNTQFVIEDLTEA